MHSYISIVNTSLIDVARLILNYKGLDYETEWASFTTP